MCCLKTYTGACLLFLTFSVAAMGLPASAVERTKIFAACAGRLSALEEHQRLFDGPLSERTAETLSLFNVLIDATLPDAVTIGFSGRDALAWQIDAKMAQAQLLQQAFFGTKPARNLRARDLATRYIQSCEKLIIGS